MMQYFNETLETIKKAINTMDENQFRMLLRKCEETVRNGNKIIASGLGKNVPICEKFVGTLLSLGMPAAFLHNNSAMHGDLGIVGPNDLLILLSKSGGTKESVDLAQYLLLRGTELWLMTFGRDSALCRLIENRIELQLENEGDKWDLVPNNSTSVYLILLQGLAIQLADQLEVPLETFKQNHPGGKIGEMLQKWE